MKTHENLQFESPSFIKRLKGMLGVDFYRLFHTPLFYIFLAIAAIIPAMILGTTGMETANATTSKLYKNTWQMIAVETPLYAFKGIDKYANMNMVFIFGGIMVSIFIGRDYKSGYVKQLFTTHAKKEDYMISKSLLGAFSMVCMCATYLLGTIAAGLLVGASFKLPNGVDSLLFALLGKMAMSMGWASLYTFLNVVFRRYFGISIAASFLLGTGVLVIGVGSVVGNSALLNVFLYGSSVYACLSATVISLLVCIGVSVAWALIYNVLGSILLYRSDVY